MSEDGFADWVAEFEGERARRARLEEPRWEWGANLPATVCRSLQKFQIGEDGDGRNLIGKADLAGGPHYAAAVRLFIGEESNHARLLARLLETAGVATLTGHWSDRIFMRVRRLLGLRLELMVLMTAELVAVEYYRDLRDGVADPLTREVAARILRDEQRHIPFHTRRLHDSIAELPIALRPLAVTGWRLLLLAAALFVAVDHGPALHSLRASRTGFVLGVLRSSVPVAAGLLGAVGTPGAAAAHRAPA
ncbi:ferritin-like domain-containing protein [Kitasatospora acidiphila]|uniref:Ferritin-like domain-containing protein n=1 Tax=Kitasatospora acidiphila TaxID=2567942 RepID=A0A540W0J0_9ACTN|nr:ferritin-like domain-containing protein [Kitasatospora acidiphila]TQF02477.1 ferritin-like domain-containing protein [Kitasatospora acidiphila]